MADKTLELVSDSLIVNAVSPKATAERQDGGVVIKLQDVNGTTQAKVYDGNDAPERVQAIGDTIIKGRNVVETIGTPPYLSQADLANYSEYGLTEPGWYVFVRVTAEPGAAVTAETTIDGCAGYVAEVGEDHVDLAIHFGVTAMAQVVTINWGAYSECITFRASDLAIRNLDYRVTFYVYDADEFVTWTYALTTDTAFVAGKAYYTQQGDEYVLAEVMEGDPVPENTYYNHSKARFEGLTRNVTYKLDTPIDCPTEFVLPIIEDETHGAWFEIRLMLTGSYSTLLVKQADDVKVAKEHTQAEKKGLNMINLHYSYVDGKKIWRFMNTVSTYDE